MSVDNGNVAAFYTNNDKTTKALQRTGNPIPSGLSNLDGFIHSITDPGSPVKMRITSVTEGALGTDDSSVLVKFGSAK